MYITLKTMKKSAFQRFFEKKSSVLLISVSVTDIKKTEKNIIGMRIITVTASNGEIAKKLPKKITAKQKADAKVMKRVVLKAFKGWQILKSIKKLVKAVIITQRVEN